jgi:CBS domain-containing protein
MKTNYPISSLLFRKTGQVWSISPDAKVFDAIKFMAEKDIGALPVIAGGKLLGIFTERDYTRKIALAGKTSRETAVFEVLSERCTTVGPHDTVEECMRLMTEKRVRHLPVLDGNKLVGIVSIGDLVNWIISMQNLAIEQMEQYIAGGVTA